MPSCLDFIFGNFLLLKDVNIEQNATILENTADIAENAADIMKNSGDIMDNSADIATLRVRK